MVKSRYYIRYEYKLLNSVANFIKKRTFELMGLILIFVGIALSISFATYSPSDPSLVYGEKMSIKNFFGIYGEALFQTFYYKALG